MTCVQVGPVKLSLFAVVLVICVVFILGCMWWFSGTKERRKFVGITDKAIDEYNRLWGQKKKRHKHEEECRRVLQKLFGVAFPSVRPDWLKSPYSGRNLELDCYNAQLNLAVERDGRQHAKYVPHFHRNGPEDFKDQQRRDKWKDKRCKELGLNLIRVPHTVKLQNIEGYLKKQLRKLNYNV